MAERRSQLNESPRQHQSVPHRATPATAYQARPKATPGARSTYTHDCVRRDTAGTLRTGGRVHHIGIGWDHVGTHILLLAHDLHIRIINAASGELLRELTLDPIRAQRDRAGNTVRSALSHIRW